MPLIWFEVYLRAPGGCAASWVKMPTHKAHDLGRFGRCLVYKTPRNVRQPVRVLRCAFECCPPQSNIEPVEDDVRRRSVVGRSQVVRQRILIPPFGGSNPPAPANDRNKLGLAEDWIGAHASAAPARTGPTGGQRAGWETRPTGRRRSRSLRRDLDLHQENVFGELTYLCRASTVAMNSRRVKLATMAEDVQRLWGGLSWQPPVSILPYLIP